MNDELKIMSRRLEELAAMLRGSVGMSAQAAMPRLPDAQANDGFDRDQRHASRYGTVHALPKADAARQAMSETLQEVEAMISIRDLRYRYFERDLFFDPAWSMLIDLYRAKLKGQRLSVTAVCIASGVADTTALRYVRVLEEHEYVHRVPDPQDRRRVFVQLTAKAVEKLDAYFGNVNARRRAA